MAKNFTGPLLVAAQELYASSTTQQHAVGEKAVTADGRSFRYCKAGLSALVVGNAIQTAVQDTAHQDLTPTANAAIGAKVITATLGASAALANQYAGGKLTVSVTPGLGQSCLIAGHAAVLSGGVITVNLEDELRVAITAANSKMGLIANLYDRVIQSPTTATGAIIGGCVFPIAASEYGWLQTGGLGAALIAGTPAIAQMLGYSATAGALAIQSTTLHPVAHAVVTGQAGLVQPVRWCID